MSPPPVSGPRDDALERWAARRAPELLARAEAEAVAVLRDALLAAGLSDAERPRLQDRAPETPEGRAPEPPPAVTPRDDRELLWAYCVLRAGELQPAGVEGVAASGVEPVQAGDLVALVSRVPAEEFAAEPLTANLNDLVWLERVARRHEAVLDAALAQSTIVPLRMCTIYESMESVREMLDRQHAALTDSLQALEGRLEWAVKVLVDRDRLMSEARSETGDAEIGALAGEGGAYLKRRRADREARETVSRMAADIAHQVHARLQDWAIDARTRPPQNPQLSGHEGEMVLNAAYLVERERTDELRQIVSELEEHHRRLGVRIELTGPWPAYNFVPAQDATALA